MAAIFETELTRTMAAAKLARRRPRPSIGGRAHVAGAKVAERQLPWVAVEDGAVDVERALPLLLARKPVSTLLPLDLRNVRGDPERLLDAREAVVELVHGAGERLLIRPAAP
jgi:hypothetical protein